jgi:hypothetical protein
MVIKNSGNVKTALQRWQLKVLEIFKMLCRGGI